MYKRQTEDRFDRILEELRQDREAQERKWAKQDRKWEEQNRKWWQAQEEQRHKWEEGRVEFRQVHEEIMVLARKHDRHIGALGARWGLQSEATFRNALAGILEKNFDIEVLNVNEYDEQGEVFGQPEQVELDVIVKNGLLLLCELKSSMSGADMYTFERKVRFYERSHDRKADRMIVISPMIDEKARQAAKELGIETYSEEVEKI